MAFETLKIAILQTPSSTLNIALHGGIERVELNQLEYLSKAGHDTKLFASKVVGHKERVYQITDLGYRNRYFQLFYYINFWLRNYSAQIFHGHYTPMLGLLFPKKSIIHFHGLGVSELPLYRYFKKRFHKAHYIFCAKWVMEDFKKLYPAIPVSQLHVVYNGVDSVIIKPGKKDLTNSIKNICFYAGWIPEKGIYDVLKAAEILNKKRNDFKIWYGGSAFSHYNGSIWGDSREIDLKVREWAEKLPCIELVGNIIRQDIPSFLAKMDIGLVPSTYPDPFPLVPLEMMAAGLPVIAYDLGGLKELIKDGVNGYLIENKNTTALAEKIAYLLDNPSQIHSIGIAARLHVEKKLSWEQHIEELLNIYRIILDNKY